ncbi:hypothetical protein NDU88_002140 [Pleurodeles waltl]|uniref:Uncharacterized protein n=1 Tax=Pleurodeles waltl TaxID=8319 RepID=A0AAV7Q695_PLEWA|nr:hypothetical protein NDU88_002140 [Pleurodeles waltl]
MQRELWVDMSEAYVEALEDQECSPERYLALLKHRLGVIGLREFKNLPQMDNTGEVDVYQLAKKQLQEHYGKEMNVVLEQCKLYVAEKGQLILGWPHIKKLGMKIDFTKLAPVYTVLEHDLQQELIYDELDTNFPAVFLESLAAGGTSVQLLPETQATSKTAGRGEKIVYLPGSILQKSIVDSSQ